MLGVAAILLSLIVDIFRTLCGWDIMPPDEGGSASGPRPPWHEVARTAISGTRSLETFTNETPKSGSHRTNAARIAPVSCLGGRTAFGRALPTGSRTSNLSKI
jgi:hypothetical protein